MLDVCVKAKNIIFDKKCGDINDSIAHISLVSIKH